MKYIFTLLLALLPMIGGAQTNGAANCQVNPSACQAAPTPSTCPSGFSWTLGSKGYAHCAKTTTETRSRSCPSGTEGDWEQERTVTSYVDGTSNAGSWTTTYKSCEAIPPPSCSNGAGNYPACDDNQPKSCSNGATNFPACDNNTGGGGGGGGTTTCPAGQHLSGGVCVPDSGSCSNGASDWPTCTPPSCSNGATNYPMCNSFPPCTNGANDPPTCSNVPVVVNGACGPTGYQGPGQWCVAYCESGTTVAGKVSTTSHGMWGSCTQSYQCVGSGGGSTASCSVSGDSQ